MQLQRLFGPIYLKVKIVGCLSLVYEELSRLYCLLRPSFNMLSKP